MENGHISEGRLAGLQFDQEEAEANTENSEGLRFYLEEYGRKVVDFINYNLKVYN